jgi:hypothetical protein
MAISLVANDQATRSAATRATGDQNDPEVITDPTEGYAAEYDILDAKSIIFYFFDANGKAFAIDDNGNNYVTGSDIYVYDESASSTDYKAGSTSEGGTTTYDYTLQDSIGSDTSSSKSSILIVLEKKSGDTPSQVVAVVNNTNGTTFNKLDLSVLRTKLVEAKTLNDITLTEGTASTVTSCAGSLYTDNTSHYEKNVTEATTKYFTMSNSAYQDASGDCIYATTILPENIKTSATAAAGSPVNIYVERLVAKVTNQQPTTDALVIKDPSDTNNGNLKISVVDNSTDGKTSYEGMKLELKGWKLYNTTTSTNLIKSLDEGSDYNWPDKWSGWNSTSDHRSYWAAMTHSKLYSDDDKYVGIGNQSLSFNDIAKYSASKKGFTASITDDVEYTFENTLPYETNSKKDTLDNHTGIVYAAQIQDANGKSLELARWLSQYYTVAQLKASITKILANKLYTKEETTVAVTTTDGKPIYTDSNNNEYYKDGDKYYSNDENKTEYTGSATLTAKTTTSTQYTAITADDFEFISDSTEYKGHSYNVAPKLTEKAVAKTWYNKETGKPYAADTKYNTSVSSTTESTTVTAILQSVPKAQIWTNGYCYYYTKIKHPIDANGSETTPAVVRNHWYQLTVNGIKGLGTPVFDPADAFDPNKPEDSSWYLDAQIHVLGWKTVQQNVTLE